MISTSYTTQEAQDLITNLVKIVNPKTVFEIGTQQGGSAIMIGKGMGLGSTLYTCDLFEEKYDAPPYKNTGANIEIAKESIKQANLNCQVEVKRGTISCLLELNMRPDIVHCDIGNSYTKLPPVLKHLLVITNKLIILEGGVYSLWMRESNITNNNNEFLSYHPILHEPWIADTWDHITINLDNIDRYAVTILTRTK